MNIYQKSDNHHITLLVLQGGGALGAYQYGVYCALDELNYKPDWVAGMSIGGINAAIIAGNVPEKRVQKLNDFWNEITIDFFLTKAQENQKIKLQNLSSANFALLFGQPGFFTPRAINPNFILDTTPDNISFYDTKPLYNTLLKVIDFDYLNAKNVRLTLCVTDIESGQLVYFDNTTQEIRPEHIVASASLPPGFAAVKIDNKFYWDGGVYSNTPLDAMIDNFPQNKAEIDHILCFMVDLFSASGPIPHSLDDVLKRRKDIQYSSHYKRNVKMYDIRHNLYNSIISLSKKMTADQLNDPEVQQILKTVIVKHTDLVHLVYQSPLGTELESTDYEFSKSSFHKHRELGYLNTKETIKNSESNWFSKSTDKCIHIHKI